MTASSPSPKLADLPAGPFHTVAKVRPVGSLQARRQASGALLFYWRYSLGSKSERVQIGIYDPSAPPKQLEPTPKGYSLSAAIRAAESLALEHFNAYDQGGRPALVKQRKQAEERTKSASLNHLLTEYCDYLQAIGRQSHKNARSIFTLHVLGAFPEMAAKAATDVSSDEIADAMRRLLEAGKGRTANKLRSYVHAAYEVAVASRTKPSIPEAFKTFGIRSNPAAEVKPDETANQADKNPLELADLKAYWRLIKKEPGFKGAVLRLHLLTGGQRIEQLVRLRTEDIKPDAIILYDGKGRPGSGKREHWVPLTKEAKVALSDCNPKGIYALSTDKGETPLANTTLSNWAKEVVGDKIAAFTAKRVRSGVETALASARVSQEIRGRLQSHGISGVQNRHYNGHDYLDDKRDSLEKLVAMLRAPESTGKRKSKWSVVAKRSPSA